jgi:hypothetical protein
MDNKLLQAYTQAQYRIHDPKIIFGVGDVPDNLRHYLSSVDCHSFAFITAYNPYSQELSLQENQQRNRDLLQDISWYTVIHGAGGDADGKRDAEESFLVCNINKDIAIDLARKYEQNALLYWDGGDVELLLLM